jgi:hypothetical protein
MRWTPIHARWTVALAATAALPYVAAGSASMPMPITNAPLDRVVANLEARLKEHPDDAEAHYSLGRAHALAYASKSAVIRGYGGRGRDFEPLPPTTSDPRPPEPPPPEQTIGLEQLRTHLTEGVKNLVAAIRRERKARYYLALASLLESAGADAPQVDVALMFPPVDGFVPGLDADVSAIPGPRSVQATRNQVLYGVHDPDGWPRLRATEVCSAASACRARGHRRWGWWRRGVGSITYPRARVRPHPSRWPSVQTGSRGTRPAAGVRSGRQRTTPSSGVRARCAARAGRLRRCDGRGSGRTCGGGWRR